MTHGMSGTRIYFVWKTMIRRCHAKNSTGYYKYGARGIKVCRRWRDSFENFYIDMGSAFEEGLQIDRINNSKGYSKNNCRWVTSQENNNNRRNNRFILTPKGKMTLAQATRTFGIPKSTLQNRLKRNWPMHKMFTRNQ